RFAQVSSAKFDAGYFNAYARIADREDLNFILHLGNYIYGTAGGEATGMNTARRFELPHECKTLDDYRRRYNQYHRVPDVQRMHAAHPIIAALAEHELAPGAWRGGAESHDPQRDGPWPERVRSALRARWEWLPVRQPDPFDASRVYRSVRLGRLADLLVTETHVHRDQPAPPPEMYDPNRTQLGLAQRKWLFEEFDRSTARWRLLAMPSILGTLWRTDLPDPVRLPLLRAGLLGTDGEGPDCSSWDGYPAERYLLMRHIRDHKLRNSVVLSGNSGISLVQELKMDPFDPAQEAIAVECANAGVNSPYLDDGFYGSSRTPLRIDEQELLRLFPQVKYLDLNSHGYNVVDLTAERVRVEWWYADTVHPRSDKEHCGASFEIKAGPSASTCSIQ
ncbi:MAG TPA: alkaline phosphatase D family protein, partial [Anaerolineales bacterium]|nr:alkaline phosphatase D family protein [Anaerolineales bacterium]